MKSLFYLLPLLALLSCGGNENTAEEESSEQDTLYGPDHEWIISAKNLKNKLAELQASFTEIGNKEVEETICGEASQVPYTGHPEEMNIWLMTTYVLNNFSPDDFGRYDFKMPEAMIREVTPLSELNWLNLNALDTTIFDLYRTYPDLTGVPRESMGEDGVVHSTSEMVQKPQIVLNAIEDGLLCVVVITDYVPPVYVSEKEYETGYVMGYLTFADWENGELSCITPFFGENSATIDFSLTPEAVSGDKYSKEIMLMNADLQERTFAAIDSIARVRTGFQGEIFVNSGVTLEQYKE